MDGGIEVDDTSNTHSLTTSNDIPLWDRKGDLNVLRNEKHAYIDTIKLLGKPSIDFHFEQGNIIE